MPSDRDCASWTDRPGMLDMQAQLGIHLTAILLIQRQTSASTGAGTGVGDLVLLTSCRLSCPDCHWSVDR